MAWIGKDGQKYDTFNEKIFADNAWDEQREEQQRQIALLNTQNRIIEMEKANDRKTQQQLEEERQNHDKEMRLLGLCDKIGISKKTYDDFVDYLIVNKDYKEIEEIKLNLQEIENIEKSYNRKENLSVFYDLSKYEDCLETPKTNPKIQEFEFQIEQTKEISQKQKNINPTIAKTCAWIFSIMIILSVIIGLNVKNEEIESTSFIIAMLLVFVDAYFIVKLMYSKENVKKSILKLEEKIKEEKERLKEQKEFNIDKLLDKKKSVEEALHNKEEKFHKELTTRNNDFYEFRKNHYNKDIEKFLLDMDLENILKEYDYEFISISNSTKIKDGKIDDYIDYFLKK